MSFLPPVVMEIRANAAQFLSEQGKVVASAKATASETEKAAQKEAAAARASAAEATRAAEQRVAAAETSAKAATAATDRRIAAEARATAEQAKATEMQAALTEESTAAQKAAYEAQAAAAQKAASAVEVAAARENEAQVKATQATEAASAAQTKASDLQVVAAEKSATAQEVAATRSSVAMKSVVSMANKVSAVSILAGAGVAVAATEMASKFEKSTMLLVTAGGESKDQLDGVRKGILDISASTGTSAEQMADGMYIMEKAGFRGAAGLAALKAAAEGAKDENVDLSTMSQAVTDVLLDYGYKMDNAKDATDSSVRVTNMLVAASGAAKTTMTDFAGSMAAVVPIASMAHISFDQVGGAIATMTQHGQTAQQSSQNLANLIMSLIRPNNLASAAMSQLGIDTTDLAQHLGDRGLYGTLQIVDQAIKDHTKDGMVFTGTMKDNANAAKAMDTIMGQMSPTMAKLSQGLKDGSVTQKEYSKTVKDLGGDAGALGNQFLSLYKANSGVTDQLKAGKPAYETYSAALRDVLGNVTAMRAAQMLLMNNGHEFENNIKAIGDAGKKTGQDIATWADMQETLSVKMDQTKAMVSNLGIEMGAKLLPVAKDLVGGFTDLFHGFEQGNPVLWGAADALGALAAVAIGTSIITGMVKIANNAIKLGRDVKNAASDFTTGFKDMDAAADSATGKMGSFGGAVSRALPHLGKLATGAGLAAAALKGIGLAQEAFGNKSVAPSVDEMTNAVMKLSKSADGADSIFDKFDTGVLTQAPHDVHNVTDALGYMNNGWEQVQSKAIDAVGAVTGIFGVKVTSGMSQITNQLNTMGQSLGQMVGSGALPDAARAFDEMAKKQATAGGTTQDLLDKMPAYRDALLQQANAQHVTLSSAELVEFAMGKIPAKMLEAMDSTKKYTNAAGEVKPITPELQKSLDDAGVSAEGLVNDLGKVLDGMLATGMKTESARTATANFNKTISDATNAIPELVKQNVDLSHALNATGTDFNLADEGGRQLNDRFTSVKDKGLEVAKSMVGNGKDSVVGALQDTYDNMLNAADAEGIHGQAAVDLTRNLLGIPKNVDVKTWMDDYAAKQADTLKGKADALDGRTIHLYAQADIANAWAAIDAIKAHAGDASSEILHVNSMVAANQFASGNAYSGGNGTPGSFTGGAVASIMGFYDGGLIPGTPPARPNVDNILAMVDGRPLKVRSGEFINNEPSTRMNLPWLKASNAGLNIGQTMRDRFTTGYQLGQAQPAMAGAPASSTSINITAQTNATADHIASEVAWALRTQ